jgi:hypothetical protein
MNEQPTPPHEAGPHATPGAGRSSASPGQAGGAPSRGLAEEASAQVREIIAAAERTAAAIVEDARAEARRQLDEARAEANRAAARRAEESARLTDELIGRTEAVKRQSDELLRLLGETKQHFDEASASAPPPGQPPSYLREVVGQHQPSDAPGGRHAEGARLLAAQMAVAGNSRAEIAATLRDRFAIEDPGPMLDAILGQED